MHEMTKMDYDWAIFARINAELGHVHEFIQCEFKTGYAAMTMDTFQMKCNETIGILETIISRNEVINSPFDSDTDASDVKKARQENGKIDILMQMLEILHDQNSVPVAMLFQPNPD